MNLIVRDLEVQWYSYQPNNHLNYSISLITDDHILLIKIYKKRKQFLCHNVNKKIKQVNVYPSLQCCRPTNIPNRI